MYSIIKGACSLILAGHYLIEPVAHMENLLSFSPPGLCENPGRVKFYSLRWSEAEPQVREPP